MKRQHEMPNRKNLVIVRAGDSSLHQKWLSGSASRKWDLHVSYFGFRPDPFPELPRDVSVTHDRGTKYDGIYSLLTKNPDIIDRYHYICICDDDILASCEMWNVYFEVVNFSNSSIAQPALDHRSFYSHEITLQRTNLLARKVNFVEVMMPTFSSESLKRNIEHFTASSSSWGIDYVWSDFAIKNNETLTIVDAVAFLHTRAVGAGSQYAGFSGRKAILDEMATMLMSKGVVAYPRRALAGLKFDGSWTGTLSLFSHEPYRARLYRKMKMIMNVDTLTGPLHPPASAAVNALAPGREVPM